ncbi:MAG: tRNA (N(6)-L-threonylcarbamoyladenosine(37)-C(2))-methylthiotransferase MtaB [Thermodesulfovibrionales bacterium]
MKVSLLTLGCKVNQAESGVMEGLLRARGFEIVSLQDAPELCIINTCSVTARSDYQSRQLIRRAHRAGARVLVTGCYSELNREKVQGMKGVAEVVVNGDKVQKIRELCGDSADITLAYAQARTRLFLKVQDGCSRACSYCVIPKARGAPRSICPSEVIEQVEKAVSDGYKEVVLTGIHLGLYGVDLSPRVPLHELVGEILEKTTIERLRLSSLEINEVEEGLISLFMESRRLCRHLHIPIQSGDDEVLARMNRPYDVAFFREAILEIRQRMGDMALGTDVIVGFPGESERGFVNTAELIEALPFTYLHVFPYSMRAGTPAASMGGQVPETVKKARAKRLRDLSGRKKKSYMLSQIGSTLDVLLEEEAPGGYLGTSGNYLRAQAFGPGLGRGRIVQLEIEGVSGDVLAGKPLMTTSMP